MAIERITRLRVWLLEDERPQYQIAAVCGMATITLSQYALGDRRMSMRHLRALAAYFDCTQQDLLGWEEVELGP